MERRLANLKSGIPEAERNRMANEWTLRQENYDLDPRIVDIEATEMAKQWHRYHVPELGNMEKTRKDGVI
jgi:hypothetical protein